MMAAGNFSLSADGKKMVNVNDASSSDCSGISQVSLFRHVFFGRAETNFQFDASSVDAQFKFQGAGSHLDYWSGETSRKIKKKVRKNKSF